MNETSKRLDQLEAGDRIRLEPAGIAEITSVKPARWIRLAQGKALDVQWKVISGPNQGQRGWFIGNTEEEVNMEVLR